MSIDKLNVNDIVKLSNGMIVSISWINENTRIFISTTPISSLVSYCYPEHIVEIIQHCDSWEETHDWFFKNHELTNGNPLHIELNRE